MRVHGLRRCCLGERWFKMTHDLEITDGDDLLRAARARPDRHPGRHPGGLPAAGGARAPRPPLRPRVIALGLIVLVLAWVYASLVLRVAGLVLAAATALGVFNGTASPLR